MGIHTPYHYNNFFFILCQSNFSCSLSSGRGICTTRKTNSLLIRMVRLVNIWVKRSYFMIFQEDFEQMRSLEQDLTFLSAKTEFDE